MAKIKTCSSRIKDSQIEVIDANAGLIYDHLAREVAPAQIILIGIER